jgi:two-component system cell cycle response regulator DivK
LVDDEPDILTVFKRSLERQGFEVHVYSHRLQAFEKFRPNYFDLLIFDFKMCEMNGFELYGKIKEIDKHAKVCFLSADGHHYKEHQQGLPELDATYFLHKPISMSRFVARMKKVFAEDIGK